MTGPEHYREAEQLLLVAIAYGKDGAPQTADRRRFEAQVHATLALAAATALNAELFAMHNDINHGTVDQWYDATAPKAPEAGESNA